MGMVILANLLRPNDDYRAVTSSPTQKWS